MKKLMFLFAPMAAILLAFTPGDTGWKCHSEVFTKAKHKLDRMVLTPAQRASILTYEQTFRKQWNATHQSRGCSHHEAHANEFVAAAAGVLSADQFVKFRGRNRNRFETIGNELWTTRVYLDNLVKIAESL